MVKSLNHNNSGFPDVTLSYLAMICTTKLLKQSPPERADSCYNIIMSGFEYMPGSTEKQSSLWSKWTSIAKQVPFRLVKTANGKGYTEESERAEVESTGESEEENRALMQERADKAIKAYYARKQEIRDDLDRQNEELIAEMDRYRARKVEKAQAERALELTERRFNEVMTTPDELEQAVLSGEEGISMHQIEFEGKMITVYELEGYPIRFLQHVVDYRDIYDPNGVGSNTTRQILENPSVWMSNMGDVERRMKKAVGHHFTPDKWTDNISTSYIDADINLAIGGVISKKGVVYGFSRIPSDSLISLTRGDAGTNVDEASGGSKIKKYYEPIDFASGDTTQYNEAVIKRYRENGEPLLLPDFMIVHEGRNIDTLHDGEADQLTDYTLRHAAYFGIPIVRIHDESYREKALDRIATKIENLDENAPYMELASVILSINGSNMFYHSFFPTRKTFTAKTDDVKKEMGEINDKTATLPRGTGEKFYHLVAEVEPVRRLDYIEEFLLGDNAHDARISIGTTALDSANSNNNFVPTYGKQIEIIIPGVPKTNVRSDSPEYPRIKAAVDKYISLGGKVI